METQTDKINHADMVRQLAKDGNKILAELSPLKCHQWHMATGISSEAGELLDAIKKVVAYNKPADRVNIVEELGDLEFYMAGLRQAFDITREETLEANIAKLGKRYKQHQYSDEQAHARADKESPALPENAIEQSELDAVRERILRNNAIQNMMETH